MPTPDANGAIPMSEYPDLLAMIPETIGGQSTHSRQSYRLVEFLCVAAGQAIVDQAIAATPAGFDLTLIQYAGAGINIGETSTIAAVRIPGQPAASMVEDFGALGGAMAGAGAPVPGTSTPATVGGKSVVIFQPTQGGRTSYLYATGDVLFLVVPHDDDVAVTIIGALP